MDMKKLAVTSVAAGVALFAADFVLDYIPFIGGHHPHGHHEHADMSVGGVLGALFHGVVLAMVLGWKGVGDMMAGAKAGACFGLVLSLAHSLEAMDFSGELVGAALGSMIMMGVAGAAVAVAGGASDG